MRSAKEAVAYMKKVHTLVRYLEICDGNMQEGSFRCDANVSVRPKGAGRVRHARRDQEPQFVPLRRARDQLRGRAPDRAARGRRQGQAGNASVRSRPRRDALDAFEGRSERLPLFPGSGPAAAGDRRGDDRGGARPRCRSCPDEKAARFVPRARAFRIRRGRADGEPRTRGITTRPSSRSSVAQPKLAANWVMGELSGALNKDNLDVTQSRVDARGAGGPARAHRRQHDLGQDRQGSVRGDVDRGRKSADAIIEAQGPQADHRHVGDRAAIDEVMAKNPQQLADYRSGKDKLFGFFVGQVMKATRGKANPAQLNELLKQAGGTTRSAAGRASVDPGRPLVTTAAAADGRDSRRRFHPERRRRAAVHLVLPPGRLHRAPRARLRARAVAGRARTRLRRS